MYNKWGINYTVQGGENCLLENCLLKELGAVQALGAHELCNFTVLLMQFLCLISAAAVCSTSSRIKHRTLEDNI